MAAMVKMFANACKRVKCKRQISLNSGGFAARMACLSLPSSSASATGTLFADWLRIPAGQTLVRRLEAGGLLSFSGITASAHPFLAALIHKQLPQRSLVIVTENLKAQESFQQDLETWLGTEPAAAAARPVAGPLLFYPAWEVLPHEGKLPHADVISDRLETLVTLANTSRVVVTSVTA